MKLTNNKLVYLGIFLLLLLISSCSQADNSDANNSDAEIEEVGISFDESKDPVIIEDKDVISDLMEFININQWENVKNWSLESVPDFYIILYYSEGEKSLLGFLEDKEITYSHVSGNENGYKNGYYKVDLKYTDLYNYLNEIVSK
ncbi:hypothetical protein V1503_19660 [Bacillus sp. SCS-151]|uniref:hypothetical protein n=1 Tax=Nanhaiella sioensis TaxID=3115293 RepID=UPI00397AF359